MEYSDNSGEPPAKRRRVDNPQNDDATFNEQFLGLCGLEDVRFGVTGIQSSEVVCFGMVSTISAIQWLPTVNLIISYPDQYSRGFGTGYAATRSCLCLPHSRHVRHG